MGRRSRDAEDRLRHLIGSSWIANPGHHLLCVLKEARPRRHQYDNTDVTIARGTLMTILDVRDTWDSGADVEAVLDDIIWESRWVMGTVITYQCGTVSKMSVYCGSSKSDWPGKSWTRVD